jgi:hypothetical protein
MTFLPLSKHDVFVSYAVVDNDPPLGKPHGWVTAFVHELDHALARHLGRKEYFDLWLDRKRLSCNDVFSSEIEAEVRKSAVMVILYSQGYLESAWCKHEREIFLQAMHDRLDSDRRLFLVEIDRVDSDRRPDGLRRINHLRFWEETSDGNPMRFGLPVPNPSWENHLSFYRQVAELGRQMANHLRHIKRLEQGSEEPDSTSSAVGDGRLVFLADVTDDVVDVRNEVAAYLSQFGVRTVPDSPLPAEVNSAEQVIGEYYDQAVVFAQVLGKSPGERPNGSNETYASLQWRLVRGGNKACLQWRSPKLDLARIRDAEHRRLLEGTSVRVEELEVFKKAILDEVRRLTKQQDSRAKRWCTTDAESQVRTPQLVFVNHAQQDHDFATQVCAVLQKYGFVCIQPLSEGTPEDIRTDFEANLDECKGLVLVYGQIPLVWVREQFRNVIKRLAIHPRDLRPWWIIGGPPAKDIRIGINCSEMNVVDCSSGNVEGPLTPVLAQLV